MILINLLPEESRQKRRTPIKLMMAVTASVAVNGSLIAWWAWTAFGVAAEVKSELALLEDTKAGLDPQIAYHRDLEKESKLFDAREETLKKVTANRISWTRKVDELIDVVNVGGDGEKYLVWFDDLTVDQKENARAKSYGKLKASGHSGSTNPSHVANFMDDLEGSPFCEDFKQPAPPEGSTSSRDEGLMPNEVWNFPLEVDLKAPEERKKAGAPAAEPGKDPGKKTPADKAASAPDAKRAATAGSGEKKSK
jgi:Tfp pilus assembly protein PilN